MQEHLFKCNEVQLKLILYGLVRLKSSMNCPDVLLDSRICSLFNDLIEIIVESLPLSKNDKVFFSGFCFKFNEKH